MFPFESVDNQKETVSLARIGHWSASYLVLRAQASGADGDSLFLAIGDHGDGSDVGLPASFCPPLGVTHIMSEPRTLATNLASHGVPFDLGLILL
jgi:hypothetical protein